ncbi:MAG: thiamine-phosphate kinase [Candidatus Sericytochromatia bacterium]|nr:thiamine-phosphate kinase [Candidatus Tanganyikabacteria bacterium]
MKNRPLASLKEGGILAAMARHLDGSGLPGGWVGIGDDAAVTLVPADTQLLTTIDMLVEGIHFTRATRPGDLAWKTVAVNVSDIRAMGGRPSWGVLGMSLPGALETAWLEAFAAELAEACRHFGFPIVGGDTTGSSRTISLSLTVVGTTSRAILRSTARPGDSLIASGPFGWAAAGLWCLGNPEADIPEALRRRAERAQCRPEPALLPDTLANMSRLALMDDSDGLATAALTLAKASGVALEIDEDRLDGDTDLEALAAAASIDVRLWQLEGGEDYGLVACVPGDTPLPSGWRIVGRVTAGSEAWLVAEGRRRRLTNPGWDHFPDPHLDADAPDHPHRTAP